SFTSLGMLKSAMLAAGAMLLTRCCTSTQTRRSVEWKVILTVAAAFALGSAVESSGLATAIAQPGTTLAGGGAPATRGPALRGDAAFDRADFAQRGRLALLPDRARNGGAAGDRLHAVRRRGDGGRLARLRDSAGLSDAHDGLQPRRLSVLRLSPHRHSHG